MQTILVEVRSVYGLSKFYPANEAAYLLASIAGTKTLKESDLRAALKLGMKVERVLESTDPLAGVFSGADAPSPKFVIQDSAGRYSFVNMRGEVTFTDNPQLANVYVTNDAANAVRAQLETKLEMLLTVVPLTLKAVLK